MNVILYARASSHRQAEKALSVNGQFRALRAASRQADWNVLAEFADDGVSGRTADRPGLQAMLRRVKQGGVDAVVLWKLDRLARSVEVSSAIGGMLRRHKVRLISLHESFDDSPQGLFIARQFENLAELYSNALSQDICRGIAELARRRFFPHGRPPIGYKTIPVTDGAAERKKLVPDEVFGPVVQRVFRMYLAGRGGGEIAKALNDDGITTPTGKQWSRQRICDILRKHVYVGDIVLGQGRHSSENQKPLHLRDVHPALVSQEDFDRVQEILDYRSGTAGAARWHASPYLLTGLVRCGWCPSPLVGTAAKSGQFRYYTCSRYYKEGKESCPGTRVPKDKLEQFVLDRLLNVLLAPDNLDRLVKLVNEELEGEAQKLDGEQDRIAHELSSLKARLARLFHALETEKLDLDDLAPRIKELRKSIERLEERGEMLAEEGEVHRAFVADHATVLNYVRELHSVLRNGTLSEQKACLAAVLKHIVVHENEVEIEYRLPQPEPEADDLLPPVLQSVASGGAEGT